MSLDLATQAFTGGQPGPGSRSGAKRVFARYEMGAPDESGCAILALEGAEYEVFGPKPGEPEDAPLDCLVTVRGGFTPALASFLHDLCSEGEMVLIMPDAEAPEGAKVYCPGSVESSDLPEDDVFETLIVWSSPDQLVQDLAHVFGTFESYRDKVVPESQQPRRWPTRLFQHVFGRKR